jgi:nucleotide-binding universal stress UspA family protein
MVITHVLVPIDETELSTGALPVAGSLASLTGAQLDLVSIEPVGPSRHQVQDRLDQIVGIVPPGVATSTSVVKTVESVADALAHLECSTGTVMCLATHGRGPLASLGLGSVTANLVAHAEMPVLVVGPACTARAPSDLQGSVLAAVDGSVRDDDVLPTAVRWAQAVGAELVVMTAVTRPSDPGAWTDAHDVLTDARDATRHLGLEAGALPVAAGAVDEAVLRAIDAGTSCVVMGSHRRGRLGRLLFGSTTAGVVRRARCPVLVAAPPPSGGG